MEKRQKHNNRTWLLLRVPDRTYRTHPDRKKAIPSIRYQFSKYIKAIPNEYVIPHQKRQRLKLPSGIPALLLLTTALMFSGCGPSIHLQAMQGNCTMTADFMIRLYAPGKKTIPEAQQNKKMTTGKSLLLSILTGLTMFLSVAGSSM